MRTPLWRGLFSVERPCETLFGHPHTIHQDGTKMTGNIHQLRDKAGQTEKITINLGYVDLGQIDLLVQEGFYSNRTDFIRTGIRSQLAAHSDVVKEFDRPAHARTRAARLQPRGARGGQGRRRDAAHQGGGACPYRSGRHVRPCTRHHRIDQRPRRPASERPGEIGAGRPHPLTETTKRRRTIPMKDGFAAAMRRATLLTRGGDVAGATRAIRNALAGGTEPARQIMRVRTKHRHLREPPTFASSSRTPKPPASRDRQTSHRRRLAGITNFPACGSRSARCCAGCARET